jgi:hypothetical protein
LYGTTAGTITTVTPAHLATELLSQLPLLLLLLLALQHLLPSSITTLMSHTITTSSSTTNIWCTCLAHNVCMWRRQLQGQLAGAATPVVLGCCAGQLVCIAVNDNAGCFGSYWHQLSSV